MFNFVYLDELLAHSFDNIPSKILSTSFHQQNYLHLLLSALSYLAVYMFEFCFRSIYLPSCYDILEK